MGALASYVGPNLTAVDVRALEHLVPNRVDHVLIQADLTAVAPGPLTPEAARDLGTLADIESRGGATVYRFSPASLTRARSLGWTADEMVATLAEHSRTPLPQALDYLIHDLERHEVVAASTAHQSPLRAPLCRVSDDELSPADRIDADHVTLCLAALHADAGPTDPREPPLGRGAGRIARRPRCTPRRRPARGRRDR